MNRESEASLDTYKKIITIEPNHIDSYYNIACIYSGKKGQKNLFDG